MNHRLKKITVPNLIDLIVVLACLLFAGWLMFSTFSYRDHHFLIAGKLFSDFGAHIPLIRSFSYGHNLPVQYPTFAGAPIRYHFLFYALVAGLEKIGLNLGISLNLLSTLGLTLLLCLIYFYGRLIFNRRAAGLLALILFLFNGSLAFLYYFAEHPFSPTALTGIFTNNRFPSFGPWDGKLVAAFWNLNIYTNQRHLGLSFGLSLLILYPLFLGLYRKYKPQLWVNLSLGFIMFFLPWLHQAAALMILLFSGLIIIFNFKSLRHYVPTYLITLAAAFPGLIYYAYLGGKNISFHLGFLSSQIDLGFLLKYWFYNLGLYLPIFFYLCFYLDRKGKSVIISAFSLFLIANLVQLSPDIINNHKLVNFFLLFLSLYVAGWLVNIWSKSYLARLGVVILVFCLTFSGFIDFFPIVNDPPVAIDDVPLNPAATWIIANTPKNSVFLTTSYLYNPASLAGRKTFLDYGYFNWSMGYDEHVRRQALPLIFASQTSAVKVCQLLQSFHLDYLYLDAGAGDLGNLNPENSFLARQFTPSFVTPKGAKIYSVAQNCE